MSVLLFLVNGVNHLMVVDVGWEILMYCVYCLQSQKMLTLMSTLMLMIVSRWHVKSYTGCHVMGVNTMAITGQHVFTN